MSLSNTQYDEIMRAYQDRQLMRARLISERKSEVAARSPRLASIDSEIAHLAVSKAKALLGKDHDASGIGMSQAERAALSRDISALTSERERILVSLGYPADYLSPPYVCPDCKDTGYIGNSRCHCFKQAVTDLAWAESNLTPVLKKECFENFSFEYYDSDVFEPGTDISSLAAARNAYAKCRRFAECFDTDYQNIFLFGDTGVGKTFLSNCVAGALLATGHSVVYFSAHRLFDVLAEREFRHTAKAETDYRSILDCDLLIIDDLGTEMTNSFTLSQFFVCLNERILAEKPTLISTNLDLGQLSSIYSERIFSRIISNFILLHLFGKDIRVQKYF